MANFDQHDLLREVFTTTGTGTITLLGSPGGMYRAMSAKLSNGYVGIFFARNGTSLLTATQWERWIGTYATAGGGTITRTTILDSSTGSAINWSAGTKIVEIGPAPSRVVEAATGYTVANSATTGGQSLSFDAGAMRTALGIDSNDAVTFGDLTVSNLTVNGTTTTINSTTMTIDDPLIACGDGNGADSVDLGLYATYTSSGAKHTGLFRDATDGKWKLFTALEEAPTTTVNTAGTGYAVATLVAALEGNVNGNLTGDVTGNVSGNAGTVTVGDAGGDTTTWVLLGTAQTGSLAPATDAALTYNATTNALTADSFVGNLTGNASGSSATCTGNAATATALQTARNINGVAFDGTGNITVTAAGSTLSDTVPYTKGGTGLTALGTGLQILRTNAGATAIEWATLAGGGDALKADPLSQFAATTSSQLAGVISDETGSGALVFATSPTLVTPALGTPASGTLTNCTGLPQAGTVGLTTADSPQFTAVNIGHATDTTLTRVSAGVVAVEGVNLITASSTDTLTNKTLTAPTIAASTMSGSHQVTGRTYSDLDTLTDGATITIDWSTGNTFTVTLGGSRTIAFSNDVDGQLIKVRFLQDATGGRTLTWPAGLKWAGGSAPTLTATASKADWIGFIRTGSGAFDAFVLSKNH